MFWNKKIKQQAAELLNEAVEARFKDFINSSIELTLEVEELTREVSDLKSVLVQKETHIKELENIIQNKEDVLDPQYNILFNRIYWDKYLSKHLDPNSDIIVLDTGHVTNVAMIAKALSEEKEKPINETYVRYTETVVILIFHSKISDGIKKKFKKFQKWPFDVKLAKVYAYTQA